MKKYWSYLVMILTFLGLMVLNPYQGYSQTNFANKLELKISYPIPNSQNTFKNVWEGVNSYCGSYNRLVTEHLFIGTLFQYSKFQINKEKIDLNTTSNTSSLAFLAGSNFEFIDKISLVFNLGLGYSWISYKNKDFDFSMKENGILILPKLNLEYLFFRNWGFGVSIAYPVVFEHFGDEAAEEDSTIRWWDIGGGVIFKF